MSENIQTSGLGGSCHWCTEGIFQSLVGVGNVKQGWITSEEPHQKISEAILLDFDAAEISLEEIISIHLHSHSCTSAHQFRAKYRSAIYFFTEEQKRICEGILKRLQTDFSKPIITKILPLKSFEQNVPEYLNYYWNNIEKPFCKNYITPKLKMLQEKFVRNLRGKALLALQDLEN
ncbi:peptide-methionine (S)-S-oxide reductase [Pedobacter sp. UYEF25]